MSAVFKVLIPTDNVQSMSVLCTCVRPSTRFSCETTQHISIKFGTEGLR